MPEDQPDEVYKVAIADVCLRKGQRSRHVQRRRHRVLNRSHHRDPRLDRVIDRANSGISADQSSTTADEDGGSIQFGWVPDPGSPPCNWNLYWLADDDLSMKASRMTGGSGSRSGTWVWERGGFPHPRDEPVRDRGTQILNDFRFERLLAREHFPGDPLRIDV